MIEEVELVKPEFKKMIAQLHLEEYFFVKCRLIDTEHKAEPAAHSGFPLGGWVPPNGSGTSYHGTSLWALMGILGQSGRINKGRAGDPVGVYHSEQLATAMGYMRTVGELNAGLHCI